MNKILDIYKDMINDDIVPQLRNLKISLEINEYNK